MTMKIDEVQRWIDANLTRIQAAEDVALYFRIPMETLRKDFVRECGEPVWQYIRGKKVERMKYLLAMTDGKCVSICWEVGIKREDTGAKMFRAVTGMTMGEYRRHCGDHSANTRSGGGVNVANRLYQNCQPESPTTLANQNCQENVVASSFIPSYIQPSNSKYLTSQNLRGGLMRNTRLTKAVVTMVLVLIVLFQVSILATPAKSAPEFYWMITRCRPIDPNNYAVRCGLNGNECNTVVNCTEFPYPS